MTLILLASCESKTSYKSTKAVVINTKQHHWGYGYFKLEVFYKYFNGIDTVMGHSTAEGKERRYTTKYITGDSLQIGFNPSDSTDTFIIEKTYAQPRMKN